jgi:MYXO-CTERM domain-containing protein
MIDPGSIALSPQPDNMSKYNPTTMDNGGVHINSGIPNNAAYLMTMGGTNKSSGIVVSGGIGWERAEQVWYRAATEYLGATSDFKAAAQATLSAAADLGYPESTKATIECAWIAVGVITTPSACRMVTDDGGAIDAPRPDGGGGPTADSGGGGGMIDSAVVDSGLDTTSRDAGPDVSGDAGRPIPDASTIDTSAPDATTTADAATADTATSDAPTIPDPPSADSAPPPADTGPRPGATKPSLTANESGGCGCRVAGEPNSTPSTAAWGSVLALALASARRRARKVGFTKRG